MSKRVVSLLSGICLFSSSDAPDFTGMGQQHPPKTQGSDPRVLGNHGIKSIIHANEDGTQSTWADRQSMICGNCGSARRGKITLLSHDSPRRPEGGFCPGFIPANHSLETASKRLNGILHSSSAASDRPPQSEAPVPLNRSMPAISKGARQ